jgi:hypothetical protein
MFERRALAVVGTMSALVLVGCGSSGSPGGGTEPSGSSGTCTIYDSGNDARIVVTSGGQSECSTLAASLSSGGSFWTAQPQDTSDPLSMVCVMEDNGNVAEVIDGGGQYIGQSVCSGFETSGWTEDTQAESQIREQEQQAANAQASAAAAAARSQATQQQDSQDRQTAEADLSTLQSDASLSSGSTLQDDLSSFAGDLSSATSDLATTRSDAAQSNSYCGASDDAEGDAEDVEGDAEDVGGDVQDLQADISTVQTDIAALKGDLATLTKAQLADPTGARETIKQAQANITSAISTANGYIGTVNQDVLAAYAVANGISTGDCSGSAQSTPSPIPLMQAG